MQRVSVLHSVDCTHTRTHDVPFNFSQLWLPEKNGMEISFYFRHTFCVQWWPDDNDLQRWHLLCAMCVETQFAMRMMFVIYNVWQRRDTEWNETEISSCLHRAKVFMNTEKYLFERFWFRCEFFWHLFKSPYHFNAERTLTAIAASAI